MSDDPEVPEADALEQHQARESEPDPAPAPVIDEETPEADAVEQAQEPPGGDDEDERR